MTCTSVSRRGLVRAILLSLAMLIIAFGAQAQSAPPLPSQTTSQDGVVVRVTPKVVGPDTPVWKFAVALDTHSQELADDLANASVLVVDGTELKPTGWSGATPGGHHRDGTLTFAVPQPSPRIIELRIQRSNESAPRVFRWDASAAR